LPHGDGIRYLAPTFAPAMGFKDIPVEIALATHGFMPGWSRKRYEQRGNGEEDGDDLVVSMHAEGMTA